MSEHSEITPAPAWQEFLTQLAGAAPIEGTVVSVLPFGAFVRLHDGASGGVDGLLHVSEWRGGEPQVGGTVSVRVLQLDLEQRRVSLTAV
ncbi:hypothetical protein GCM10009836_56130 [Pseudonocardia ailaonensis]|uniref:S1 motif domain-containing protein n=1 Tax=Pseudonocardia ailaonensis TaxID=367279 RepID=A0ABN2NGH5_9PSEU